MMLFFVSAHLPTMFDFLFKRSAKKAAAVPPASVVAEVQKNKQEEAHQRKNAALQQLAAIQSNQSELADFIIACDFADVRLKAAEALQNPADLDRVLVAMRNSDRRVAKLVQGRLKEIAHTAALHQQADACLAQIQQLLTQPTLAASQLVDLDHRWKALDLSDEPWATSFATSRAALGERLKAQVELQRKLQQALADLRSLLSAVDQYSPTELVSKLEQLASVVADYAAAPEADSLPKALLEQFSKEYSQTQKSLEQLQKRYASTSERESTLATWEQAVLAELKVEALKRNWSSLPGEPTEALQTRFDALLQGVYAERKPAAKEEVAPVANEDAQRVFGEALDALEAALQEGLLQVASKNDKVLRGIDSKTARATADQLTRLGNARGELIRLQDWAKWGGNVSREELVKVVEELPAEDLAPAELAKKIGSSRDRWKGLDATSGPAPKPLWERFDAACTAAYAPVAAHYKKLSEERLANQAQAQAILDEVAQFTQTTLPEGVDLDSVDWKALSAFTRRVSQAWKRLGHTDRKEKKRLDTEFETGLQGLLTPLAQQQQAQIALREKLIADVSRLKPADRTAVDTLRGIQARWQELAKAMPLERNDEQALWTRFREASDTLFAQRKASAEAAESERQQNLTLKEAQLTSLEALKTEPNNVISQALRDSAAAWKAIGQIPRAVEAEVEQRYQTLVSSLQAQVDESKRAAQAAQRNALGDKLRLCQQAEAAFAAKKAFDAKLQAAWDALPKLPSDEEKTMAARFAAVLAAWEAKDQSYLAVLEQNRETLLQALLRQEIVAGLDSPAELAAERLKLQVDVLKSAMKSGQKPATQHDQVLVICGLPALLDKPSGARLEQLLQTMLN